MAGIDKHLSLEVYVRIGDLEIFNIGDVVLLGGLKHAGNQERPFMYYGNILVHEYDIRFVLSQLYHLGDVVLFRESLVHFPRCEPPTRKFEEFRLAAQAANAYAETYLSSGVFARESSLLLVLV